MPDHNKNGCHWEADLKCSVLTDYHQRELEPSLDSLAKHLIRKTGIAHIIDPRLFLKGNRREGDVVTLASSEERYLQISGEQVSRDKNSNTSQVVMNIIN